MSHHQHELDIWFNWGYSDIQLPNKYIKPPPFILCEDNITCSADFLLFHYLYHTLNHANSIYQSSINNTNPTNNNNTNDVVPIVIFVCQRNPFSHYMAISKKLGLQLSQYEQNGLLHVVSAPATIASSLISSSKPTSIPSSTDNPSSTSSSTSSSSYDSNIFDRLMGIKCDENKSNSLNQNDNKTSCPLFLSGLYSSILSIIKSKSTKSSSSLPSLPLLPPIYIAFDSMDYCFSNIHSVKEQIQFFDSIQTLTSNSGGGLFIVNHADVAGNVNSSMLLSRAELRCRLLPLTTGWSKHVTGILLVTRKEPDTGFIPPATRLHYCLSETSVKVSLPGQALSGNDA